jgi:hypothetical protein
MRFSASFSKILHDLKIKTKNALIFFENRDIILFKKLKTCFLFLEETSYENNSYYSTGITTV